MPAWRAGPRGTLKADIADMRLTVRTAAWFGSLYRFTPWRQPEQDGPFEPVNFGTEMNLHDAIRAAERLAAEMLPVKADRV